MGMKKRISVRGIKHTQTTSKGLVIRTPTRSEVLRDLEKLSRTMTEKPPKGSGPS